MKIKKKNLNEMIDQSFMVDTIVQVVLDIEQRDDVLHITTNKKTWLIPVDRADKYLDKHFLPISL